MSETKASRFSGARRGFDDQGHKGVWTPLCDNLSDNLARWHRSQPRVILSDGYPSRYYYQSMSSRTRFHIKNDLTHIMSDLVRASRTVMLMKAHVESVG